MEKLVIKGDVEFFRTYEEQYNSTSKSDFSGKFEANFVPIDELTFIGFVQMIDKYYFSMAKFFRGDYIVFFADDKNLYGMVEGHHKNKFLTNIVFGNSNTDPEPKGVISSTHQLTNLTQEDNKYIAELINFLVAQYSKNSINSYFSQINSLMHKQNEKLLELFDLDNKNFPQDYNIFLNKEGQFCTKYGMYRLISNIIYTIEHNSSFCDEIRNQNFMPTQSILSETDGIIADRIMEYFEELDYYQLDFYNQFVTGIVYDYLSAKGTMNVANVINKKIMADEVVEKSLSDNVCKMLFYAYEEEFAAKAKEAFNVVAGHYICGVFNSAVYKELNTIGYEFLPKNMWQGRTKEFLDMFKAVVAYTGKDKNHVEKVVNKYFDSEGFFDYSKLLEEE